MNQPWRSWLAGGTLGAVFVLSGLVLGGGPAGAAKPSASTKVFCTDTAKVAKAGDALLIHPSLVAANRAVLMALVASNFLGQNTPAIMATEAQYEEMWVQDVTAMLGYHVGAASGETTSAPRAELQTKATVVLEKLDADLHKTCPGDTKAFTHLTALEKTDGADG
jgi:PPE family